MSYDSLPDEPDPDLCMCDTLEEGWRPCPVNLCERPDHDHSRCGCERRCGALPEEEDHRRAVCRGLRR